MLGLLMLCGDDDDAFVLGLLRRRRWVVWKKQQQKGGFVGWNAGGEAGTPKWNRFGRGSHKFIIYL
jgi:hypothetical protein